MPKRGTLKGVYRRLIDVQNKPTSGQVSKRNNLLARFPVTNYQELSRYMPFPSHCYFLYMKNGEKRRLTTPHPDNKALQQLILEYVHPHFVDYWSEYSFGFIPRRSREKAINYARKQAIKGYRYGSKIDFCHCFENIPHEKLWDEAIYSDRISKRLVERIFALLHIDIKKPNKGLPVGHPLSPFLMNIYLTRLDRCIERKGFRFYRYGDDLHIFSRTRHEAEQAQRLICHFIEDNLEMPINLKKTKVQDVIKSDFLGYELIEANEKIRKQPAGKNIDRLKIKVLEVVSRYRRHDNVPQLLHDLNLLLTGWINAFRSTTSGKVIKELDDWILYTVIEAIGQQRRTIQKRRKALRLLVGSQYARKLAPWNIIGDSEALRTMLRREVIKDENKIVSLYAELKALKKTV